MSSEDSDTGDVNGGNKLRTLLYYVVACIYNSGCRRQTVVKTRERIGLWPCRFIRSTPLHIAFCSAQDVAGVGQVPGGRVGQHKGHEDQGVQRSFRPEHAPLLRNPVGAGAPPKDWAGRYTA